MIVGDYRERYDNVDQWWMDVTLLDQAYNTKLVVPSQITCTKKGWDIKL